MGLFYRCYMKIPLLKWGRLLCIIISWVVVIQAISLSNNDLAVWCVPFVLLGLLFDYIIDKSTNGL